MKITYGPAVLGDDSVGDVISIQQWEHRRSVYTKRIFGGESQKTVGLDNRSNAFVFIVEKKHTDAKTAQRFLWTHGDSLFAQTALIRTQDDFIDTIPDAALESVSLVKIDGSSTVLRYTFTGGKVTTPTS